jgi:RimJ/RimL family protein N-acetyltransferase
MIIEKKPYQINGLKYYIRSAKVEDAEELSVIRLQIDGETENLDREPGEGYLSKEDFIEIIENDSKAANHLFLVAETEEGKLAGFCRCEGSILKRLSHKVEFGICILKEYWGYSIGKSLLQETIVWADSNNIRKITLNVLETNEKAIHLYQQFGFLVEGILRNDKFLSDGNYYSTVVMGRLKEE